MLFYGKDAGSFVDMRHYLLGILKFPEAFLGEEHIRL